MKASAESGTDETAPPRFVVHNPRGIPLRRSSPGVRMEEITTLIKSLAALTWEEESGLLSFLSKVGAEVARFDGAFGFDTLAVPSPPLDIDGSAEDLRNIGFVVVRFNRTVGRDYCLYSLLKGTALHAYIGIYAGSAIRTLKELPPLTDFSNGSASLLS